MGYHIGASLKDTVKKCFDFLAFQERSIPRSEDLGQFQLIFHIAALFEMNLKHASQMEWKDFEDAIQCITAERIGADFIITRSVKNFLQSRKVSALTPAEFLERYL